ncbi:MAG: hypothetical protein F4089_10590 [Gammaproteobacteria bacterium]|nr:hypothetical protein [Gammaproteobacteria bacterium]
MTGQEWTVWIVDKLFLVVLVPGATWWATYLLERHRQQMAFRTEFSKEAVRRIGETWSALRDMEQSAGDLMKAALKYFQDSSNIPNDQALERLTLLERKAKERSRVVREMAAQHRFWIGEDFFSEVMAYHNRIVDQENAIAGRDMASAEALWQQRLELRALMLSFQEKLGLKNVKPIQH